MKIFALILVGVIFVFAGKLEEKFAWSELEFAWPSDKVREDAMKSGRYNRTNNLPLGFDMWRDKMFITVPRWKLGVASSLNYIKMNEGKSPVLHPYPSWEANRLPGKIRKAFGANDLNIVSTIRVQVDKCDRLWAMDSGADDILLNPTRLGPNAILIFDLNTDKLIRRYVIPSEQVNAETFFAGIILDMNGSDCDDVFAYLPDLGFYSVVVYDYRNNRSYRVRHHFFHFDPLMGNMTVSGINYQWTDGVFGMALGRRTNEKGDRTVYFHPLASSKEFSVSNEVLKNETFATSDTSYSAYTYLGDRGQRTQSSVEYFDEKTNVLLYTQILRDSVACWSPSRPYTPDNHGVVDADRETLIFPNDIKVDDKGNVWVLSDRLPTFLYGILKPELNYRILSGNLEKLLVGTPCASSRNNFADESDSFVWF